MHVPASTQAEEEHQHQEEYFHGEQPCGATYKQGAPCRNHAYFRAETDDDPPLLLCGVHAKQAECAALPKRSAADKRRQASERQQTEQADIERARSENVRAGRRGSVTLTRMFRMRAVPALPGRTKVFPNYRHQNRSDGIGCASLSPMSLGPVEHGQPDLPPASCVENFHQGSKCFREEVDRHGAPLELFYENRLRFYEDDVPHRHKYKGMGANKNVPLYFVWVGEDGAEHRLGYVESRQFYCTFYERLARETEDYARLERLLDEGYDLQLCGYDAHDVSVLPGDDPLVAAERAYLDATKPFGHERVLYAMLTCPRGREAELPWRRHVTLARHLQPQQ
jgi:hypothetical protein